MKKHCREGRTESTDKTARESFRGISFKFNKPGATEGLNDKDGGNATGGGAGRREGRGDREEEIFF